jgi:hypothetical protein
MMDQEDVGGVIFSVRSISCEATSCAGRVDYTAMLMKFDDDDWLLCMPPPLHDWTMM